MGANAATKAYRVVMNLERILAIELFNAAQALEFRRPMKSAPYLEDFVKKYRERVSFITEDKIMHDEIEKSIAFLQEVDYELPDALIPGI
jgi:histidine ammonia-lyase